MSSRALRKLRKQDPFLAASSDSSQEEERQNSTVEKARHKKKQIKLRKMRLSKGAIPA